MIIKEITWNQIHFIWENCLWPDRQSEITPWSAMLIDGRFDNANGGYPILFIGAYDGKKLIGVNSGHQCMDGSFRSRGLYVFPEFRKRGTASLLLKTTVDRGKLLGCPFIWSYPRKSSWPAYAKCGFELISDWETSETSELNALCKIEY